MDSCPVVEWKVYEQEMEDANERRGFVLDSMRVLVFIVRIHSGPACLSGFARETTE